MGLDSATIQKMRDLRKNKKSLSDIQKETGVSKPTIIKYTKGIKVTRHLPPAPPQPIASPVEVVDDEIFIDSTPTIVDSETSPQDAIVDVIGIPVNRKIQLTPKNLTMFQWFKTKYNWSGDISDFINDTMEYFFTKGLGAEMQVIIKENLS